MYRREKDSQCCGTALPLEEVVTNKEGIFQFKNSVPGNYWVVVTVDGKDYSHAIAYVQHAKDKVEVSCSDLLYALEDGELRLEEVITVD